MLPCGFLDFIFTDYIIYFGNLSGQNNMLGSGLKPFRELKIMEGWAFQMLGCTSSQHSYSILRAGNRGWGWNRLAGSGLAGFCHELETGGKPDDRRSYPTLTLMYKVWDTGRSMLGLTGSSRYAPIWANHSLI